MIQRVALLMLLLCASVGFSSVSAANESINVLVLQNGTTEAFKLKQPIRFAEFLAEQRLAYTGRQAEGNFSRARIGNKALQERLEQNRKEVLDELVRLVAFYQKAGAINAATAARALLQQLQRVNLFAGYHLSIKPDKLRVNLQNNFIMSAAESPYQLVLFSKPMQVIRYGVDSGNPAANSSYHWRLAANGNVAREPVALFNTDEVSRCYHHNFGQPLGLGDAERCVLSKPKAYQRPAYHTYVGINSALLPENFSGLNERIVALLKFAIEERYDN